MKTRKLTMVMLLSLLTPLVAAANEHATECESTESSVKLNLSVLEFWVSKGIVTKFPNGTYGVNYKRLQELSTIQKFTLEERGQINLNMHELFKIDEIKLGHEKALREELKGLGIDTEALSVHDVICI